MISERAKEVIESTLIGLSLVIKYAKSKVESPEDQPLHVFVAYAAEEFEFQLEGFTVPELTNLNNHILCEGQNSGRIVVEPKETPLLESTRSGIIEVTKTWRDFIMEDVVHSTKPLTKLRINGATYGSKFMDSDINERLVDEILTLLDDTGNADVRDKVGALHQIFKSPKMDCPIRCYGVLMTTVRHIISGEKMSIAEENERRLSTANMIIDKYLSYLWDKLEKKTDVRYILGFEGFIQKNKNAWKNGLENAEERIELFLEEHKTVINIFKNIREPSTPYTWQRKTKEDGRESIFKSVSPPGNMMRGLDGM